VHRSLEIFTLPGVPVVRLGSHSNTCYAEESACLNVGYSYKLGLFHECVAWK
jgi:hypothetical protein